LLRAEAGAGRGDGAGVDADPRAALGAGGGAGPGDIGAGARRGTRFRGGAAHHGGSPRADRIERKAGPVLNVLRQMSIEELRYAAAAYGAGVDASPEGIVRALCRECMVLGWGFVPLSREDALLEQVGQRLGVPSSPKGLQGIALAERRVFRALLRHAWEAADPSYQRRILEEAEGLWDGGNASRPELPPHAAESGPRSTQITGARAALEGFLAHPAGLRALAAATEV